MTAANYPAMWGMLAHAEIQLVRAFAQTIELARAREGVDIERGLLTKLLVAGATNELESRRQIVSEIGHLAEELSIIAAYRVAELNMMRLTHWLSKEATAHSWTKFSQLLLRKTGVRLLDLSGAKEVDELRLLNNAIKHTRKSTRALAQYPGWTAGKELHGLGEVLERLCPFVATFVEHLAKAVLPERLGGLRANANVFPAKRRTDQMELADP